MPTNAAAIPLPPRVCAILAVVEQTEDALFEKLADIASMKEGFDYTEQRLADLVDQQIKAPADKKKQLDPEINGLKVQISGMKKQLASSKGQATKMQHRINELRQKARDVLREIRAAEEKAKSITSAKK
jgi:chromosome segregation ATPase